jgi:hypothetical protein
MRTNGLVWAVALSLSITGIARAQENDTASSADDTPKVTSTDEMLNNDSADSGVVYFTQSPASRYFLYAGTEFSYMHARTQTGGIITASFSDTTAPGVSTQAFVQRDGANGWDNGTRFWVGAQLSDAWAVQGRHWSMSMNKLGFPNSNPNIPDTGANFATFEVGNTMEAYTIDVEAVRSWWCDDLGGWKTDMFIGARNAHFVSRMDFLAFGVFTTGNFVNLTLQNGSKFDGSGVTYGGAVRHQIGNSHAHFFTSLRGSTLYGHSDSFGRSDGTVASSPSAPLVGAATVTRANADARMYIIELQTGIQWEFALQQLPANFFFRAAYELQNWDFDAPPTGGAGFGGTIGEITTNSFASAGIGGLILEGITFGTGLTW